MTMIKEDVPSNEDGVKLTGVMAVQTELGLEDGDDKVGENDKED